MGETGQDPQRRIDNMHTVNEWLGHEYALGHDASRKATIQEIREKLEGLTVPSDTMPGASLMVYWDNIESTLDEMEKDDE